MSLRDLIAGRLGSVATATVATPATEAVAAVRSVASVATVAVANDRAAQGLIDRRASYPNALRTGALVVCLGCHRFHRGGSEWAEGMCAIHGDVWALTPFSCPQHVKVRT